MLLRSSAVWVCSLLLASTAVGGNDAFRPSPSQQVQLGKRAAGQLRKAEHVLPASDPRVIALKRVARRILATFSEPDAIWEYSFEVIDSKEINAFALPGGATFFYTGLIDKLKTEDELAGVLGHELTHVRKQHWAIAYADSQKRNLGLSVLLLAAHANSNLSNLAGLSNDLLFELPFSRKHETEADDGGFEAMVTAGYNPQGLADTFIMLRQEVKDGAPPEFFSDHPDDKNRIKRIEDMIQKSGRAYPAQIPLDLNGVIDKQWEATVDSARGFLWSVRKPSWLVRSKGDKWLAALPVSPVDAPEIPLSFRFLGDGQP